MMQKSSALEDVGKTVIASQQKFVMNIINVWMDAEMTMDVKKMSIVQKILNVSMRVLILIVVITPFAQALITFNIVLVQKVSFHKKELDA
jgi:hypothetical protein